MFVSLFFRFLFRFLDSDVLALRFLRLKKKNTIEAMVFRNTLILRFAYIDQLPVGNIAENLKVS